MDVPTALLKDFVFKTDLKSMLRGLNSLLGLNMGARSRLRSIRVTAEKSPILIASQFDLIKFFLVAEKLPDSSSKALKYEENTDSYEFINSLTGDPKDVLFIFENVDIKKYSSDILNGKALKDKYHFYSDELSALLDSYQVNNGLVYLFHDTTGSFIVNRSLTPDPVDDSRFFFYLKVFKLNGTTITKNSNFIEINRFDLSVKSHAELSGVDLGQMILPVIHLQKQD